METRKITPSDTIDKFVIVDYSEKAIAVAAGYDTALRDEFADMGGRFNSRLKFGAGWIFSKKKSSGILTSLLDAVQAAYIHVMLADMELTEAGEKDSSGGSKITLLTNPEKQQHGINVNDMATRLPGGEIITIGREPIKTDFCFGYSSCGQGPTSEEAHKALDNARSNPDYFMSENLERLDYILDKLGNPDKGEHRHLWIANWYTGDKNLWSLEFGDTPADKPEWLDSREKALYDNGKMRPVAGKEREILIEFYRQARTAREKRCKAYLKRYGLEKLHCWTYWMDE